MRKEVSYRVDAHRKDILKKQRKELKRDVLKGKGRYKILTDKDLLIKWRTLERFKQNIIEKEHVLAILKIQWNNTAYLVSEKTFGSKVCKELENLKRIENNLVRSIFRREQDIRLSKNRYKREYQKYKEEVFTKLRES